MDAEGSLRPGKRCRAVPTSANICFGKDFKVNIVWRMFV